MLNDINPYWEDATKVANSQRKKGVMEYGQTIEDNKDLPLEERLTMAIEEAVDLIFYLEHIKAGINELLEELKNEHNS